MSTRISLFMNNQRGGYVLYCRKSTEGSERQALSIPGQREWGREAAARMGFHIARVLEEAKSAKAPYQRAVFDELIVEIRRGVVHGIITWKLDRLARNPEEAGIILGLLKRGELKRIVTAEREYRPEDNALISYVDFGMADQYVRDLSRNVKRGLYTKAKAGWCPGYARLGYLNTKTNEKGANTIVKDPERFEPLKLAWQLMQTGLYTVPEVARLVSPAGELTTRATRYRSEKPIARSTWFRIFRDPFYAGRFEYPRGSGNWYQGNHEPMVGTEGFEYVQALLGSKGRPRSKRRQIFDFTGLFRCGTCAAAITAEHKTKRQKNGTIHHYTYYHCTKRKDPTCPERSVEAKDLERQIDRMLSKVSISERFLTRALEELNRVRRGDREATRVQLANRERALRRVSQQIDQLLEKYTSPQNAGGRLFSDEEFVELKSRLQQQRLALEDQIRRHHAVEDERHQRAHRAFEFSTRVRQRFRHGTREARRAIVNGLGSNPTISKQSVVIPLQPPMQLIARHRPNIERRLTLVRAAKDGATEGSDVDDASLTLLVRGLVDDVRTECTISQTKDAS